MAWVPKTKEEETWWIPLDDEAEKEFRYWARDNYKPGSEISNIWHPVVVDECNKINKEAGL